MCFCYMIFMPLPLPFLLLNLSLHSLYLNNPIFLSPPALVSSLILGLQLPALQRLTSVIFLSSPFSPLFPLMPPAYTASNTIGLQTVDPYTFSFGHGSLGIVLICLPKSTGKSLNRLSTALGLVLLLLEITSQLLTTYMLSKYTTKNYPSYFRAFPKQDASSTNLNILYSMQSLFSSFLYIELCISKEVKNI